MSRVVHVRSSPILVEIEYSKAPNNAEDHHKGMDAVANTRAWMLAWRYNCNHTTESIIR